MWWEEPTVVQHDRVGKRFQLSSTLVKHRMYIPSTVCEDAESTG